MTYLSFYSHSPKLPNPNYPATKETGPYQSVRGLNLPTKQEFMRKLFEIKNKKDGKDNSINSD